MRGPLGDLVARKAAGQTYSKTLPGVPDGDYDIVRFNTAFANRFKKAAVETVVLAREAGGWKVDGYFIR